MRKRICLIISSFLTFLFSIYNFLQLDKILEGSIASVKNTYANYPDLLERILDVLENNGHTYLIAITCIAIFISIVIFIYTLKEDHILKRKGLLIALSVIGFFMSTTNIVGLLFLFNVIVLIFSKRKVEADYPVKKDIPILKRDKVSKNDIINGIILLGVYFSQFVWVRFLPESFEIKIGIQIAFDVVVLILSIWFFFPELKRDIKAWKGNGSAYLHYIFSKYGIGLLIYFGVMALAISLTRISISVNQQGVDALPMWYGFPVAVIWAPIVEEIIFRGVLRRFIKKNTLFIIISALIFGILHTFREDGIVNIIVMAMPYATLGGIFAYVYTKTENLTCNMCMHAFHNLIGMVVRLFI